MRRTFRYLSLISLFALTQPVAGSIAHYSIIPEFQTENFSASWIHSGTSGRGSNGTWANGPRMSGKSSGQLSGGLSGNLVGNTLLGMTGTLSSTVGSLRRYDQLADYAESLAGIHRVSSSDELELRITAGGMQFETTGTGTGEYTGGWFDYELLIDDLATDSVGFVSVTKGTFYIKPQAETGGTDPLDPNRGNSGEWTAWGNNWAHDGAPYGSPRGERVGSWSDWDFLKALGHPVDSGGDLRLTKRKKVDHGIQLGIDLYAVMESEPGDTPTVPEPISAMIWCGFLAIAVTRRSSRC